MDLVKPHMTRRLQNHKINLDVRSGIRRVLGVTENTAVPEEILGTRRYCYLCPSKLHRKTKYVCVQCNNPICLGCSKKLCRQCATKID